MHIRSILLFAYSAFACCIPSDSKAGLVETSDQLESFSQNTQSDAVYVLQKGRTIFNQQKNPCQIHFDSQEITNSFISMAIALLIDDGKIPCLDVSVKYCCGENDSCESELTLRELLNSSFALSQVNPVAPLLETIQKVAGQSLENYLLKRLFLPLGIQNISWSSNDQERSPHLSISSADLAKVGYLIAEKGLYYTRRIIDEKSLNMIFQPNQSVNPFMGLQWHFQLYDASYWWDDELLQAYRDANLDEEVICRLEGLQGRVLSCSGQYFMTYYLNAPCDEISDSFGSIDKAIDFIGSTQNVGLPMARFTAGKVRSISAVGKGGQQLVIIPQKKVVAVRQKRDTCFTDDYANAQFVTILENIEKS